MKKLSVIVKEKTILELAEDGVKGDLIDLKELTQVDSSYLESIIDSGKDKVYEAKLLEFKKRLDAEKTIEIEKLNSQISELKNEASQSLKLKEQELNASFKDKENQKELEINDLKAQIAALKKESEQALIIKEKDVKKESDAIINDLKKQIELLKSKQQSEIDLLNSQNQTNYNKLQAEYDKLKDSLDDKIKNI